MEAYYMDYQCIVFQEFLPIKWLCWSYVVDIEHVAIIESYLD